MIKKRGVNEFRNLVFEGGGVKGIAYGGALEELEKKKILQKIKRVAGTSAGAITAILISLGYSAKEVTKIISETNFNNFADNDFGFLFDVLRVIRKFGWNKGNKFYNWIGELIKARAGKEDLTFLELHNLIGKNNFRDLYIVGTNLSKQFSEVYSYETSPDMQIREAARISMSIPLYFKSVKKENDIMADGGVVLNYAINVFDNLKYLEDKKNGERVNYNSDENYLFNHETLGFRLDSVNEINYNSEGWRSVPRIIKNLKDYSFALLGFMMEGANKRHLHRNDWNRTVFINTIGVKTTDFDLSQEKINALVEEGRKGVVEHFKWRNGKKGMKKPC
ncbi:MAG: patatin-like phospholipase family protein [Candidatus Pacearchaeota archaeon]|jgi:NTE family protein